MKGRFKFTEAQKQQIEEAVKKAELQTSGEIVPYFVESSDRYEDFNLRGALIGVMLSLFTIAFLSYSWALPFPITPLEIVIFVALSGLLFYLLIKYIRPLKKLIIPGSLMLERVEQQALVAFLEEEVFNTQKRTGILIFVSHFEHIVEVIGDRGINAKVKKEEWQEVVQLIVAGIKAKETTSGLVRGIDKCGELLARAGVNKPPDNPNELTDNIRVS